MAQDARIVKVCVHAVALQPLAGVCPADMCCCGTAGIDLGASTHPACTLPACPAEHECMSDGHGSGTPLLPVEPAPCHEHASTPFNHVLMLPAQVTEAGADASSGLQGKVTYSRLGGYSKTDPFNSLYLGSFGPHGPELLQLSRWVGQPAGCLSLPCARPVPAVNRVVA